MAIVHEFLAEYLESTRTLFKEIKAAFEAGDMHHVSTITHRLKSSSRSVGALALGDLFAEVENAGKEGDRLFIAKQMQELEATWIAVEREVCELLADNGSVPTEDV